MVKNLPANAGDARDAASIPGLGRSPAIGNGNPVQYSCLENLMNRVVWWATYGPWGRKESDMTEHACTIVCDRVFDPVGFPGRFTEGTHYNHLDINGP